MCPQGWRERVERPAAGYELVGVPSLEREPGATVVEEGESSRGIYLVVSGRLRAFGRTDDGAETMLRKALAINEDLGRLKELAIVYGNLGSVLKKRGDLDGAEAMHRKALEINEELGQLGSSANQYANLSQPDCGDGSSDYRRYNQSNLVRSELRYRSIGCSRYGNTTTECAQCSPKPDTGYGGSGCHRSAHVRTVPADSLE